MTRPSAPARLPSRVGYVTLHGTEEGQGAATHVREIVRGLRALGWEVEVFSARSNRWARSVLGRLAAFVLVQGRTALSLRRMDAVYLRHHPMAIPLAAASQLIGVARVEEVNGTLSDWVEIHPWSRRIERVLSRGSQYCLRTATVVIAVDPSLAAWVRAQAGRDCLVVPNAADTMRFAPEAPATPPVQSPYVVFVGALVPWAGVGCLLHARCLPEWPEGVTLVVAGDGPLRRDVERAADGIDVKYLGAVPYARVPGLLVGSRASISPNTKTEWGASPIKLYEAMACGVPVVASDVPGQGEIVREEACGVTFPAGDVHALARAVRDVIADAEAARQMGRRGRVAAVARHSWQKRAESTSTVLSQLRVSANAPGPSPRREAPS